MKISSALSSGIAELKVPVITGYQIGLSLYLLYQGKTYKGQPITNIRKDVPTRSDYTRYVKELVSYGLLYSNYSSHKDVFGVLSQTPPTAEEVACCIDPFGYISHLSAMEYHGLTDRFPKVIFLTSPETQSWTRLASDKMRKDLADHYQDYIETDLPTLRRLPINKIMGKAISSYNISNYNPGAYLAIKGQSLRVSSIGRTFLDMLKTPSLCGGIYHVLDVFEEFGKKYLKLIVNEIDRNGKSIDKVRAGYILQERLGLSEPRIEQWKSFAQRGGSRKLVAEDPYKPVFSETWCLSINIEEHDS